MSQDRAGDSNGRAERPEQAGGVLGRLPGERPERLGRERRAPARKPSRAPARASAQRGRAAPASPPAGPRTRAPQARAARPAAPAPPAEATRQLPAPPVAGRRPSSASDPSELMAAAILTAGELARITLTLYGRLLKQAIDVTRGSRRSGS